MTSIKASPFEHVALIIPAWQPSEQLVPLVRRLGEFGFGAIVLVDDGSDAAAEQVFAALQALSRVHVLTHAVNLGKGRALKTAFNYVLTSLPEIEAVVTADADGQHRPEDIAKVADAILKIPDRTVLGVRAFSGDVPLRSRWGNALTKKIFRFLTGVNVSDTQTGLRGFSRKLVPELLTLDGERYEYEMTVLASLCRQGSIPFEVPIETVYIEGNRSSHFDPVRDSMRIYFVLVRFYVSSLIAAGIDFIGFTAAFSVTHSIGISVAVGRLSSLVNFALNKKFVFHSSASVKGTIWRYYVLAAAIAGVSYLLIRSVHQYLGWNVIAIKLVVDVLLSLVSFSVQRTFVFRRNKER
ncbi:bifunctional glycosyltransferase family 2/GtrA family protein [Terriglobus tenax]|uniref:bifunctional glycosyltransferase family 2/GtrA family protein n=1 Tax=Terriglobus tenax TaxID=1111115 RepID=UPI0021DF8DE1|nr:bifunctional glycosyltransferase family 2/GtrA family protein [Terriglobus tenax]